MRIQRYARLSLAATVTLSFGLILAPAGGALAQKYNSRGDSYSKPPAPRGDGGYRGGRNHGGGYRGPGWGAAVPGIILTVPALIPPSGGQFIDDGSVNDGPPRQNRPPQRATRRGPSGAPPANERRLVPDEVVIEVSNSLSEPAIEALQRRQNLTRVESQEFQLPGTKMFRWRIPDRRSVAAVVRGLEADNVVTSAQPNYVFTLQQAGPNTEAKAEGDPAQYELAKLRLPQAHTIAKGGDVLVAVIDSGVDTQHPDLDGAIAGTFDTLEGPMTPHKHGTAIAGLIAARGKLLGAAPNAKILAIRAFDPSGTGAEATTFSILKGLDWAAANGARVINMSFAGPSDPAIRRSLQAAHKKGIVLVAAAGNAGAKSPPLYPAADANVIAVGATDADDKLFVQSNRGSHIAVTAPGAALLVAIPDAGYEMSSGTSYSAAEISGIVALLLERRSDLTPDQVRAILTATAKDLGPKGRDAMFGAGLADAFGAVTAVTAPVSASAKRRPPVERVSTGAR